MSTDPRVARLMLLADTYAGNAYARVTGTQEHVARENLRTALSEALGDSQPVAWLCKYANGYEEPVLVEPVLVHPDIDDITEVTPLYASPQRAEPASVQALREADRIFCWLERRTIYQDSDIKAVHAKIRAALAAHPSTDQNHSG